MVGGRGEDEEEDRVEESGQTVVEHVGDEADAAGVAGEEAGRRRRGADGRETSGR